MCGECFLSYSEVEKYNKTGVFGRYLQKELKANFLSIGATAKLLGVSKSAVQHWCSGRRKPTAYNCYQLAKLLNIPIQEFYRCGFSVEEPKAEIKPQTINNYRFVGL